MNNDEKKALFNSLVAGLDDADVPLLLEVIAENDHHDEIMKMAGLYDSPADASDELEELAAMDITGARTRHNSRG